MELLWDNEYRMQLYGITVGDDQLTLVLLVNIEVTKREDWGREYCPEIQAIRRL